MDAKAVYKAWRNRFPDDSVEATYDSCEVAFVRAMAAYKHVNQRPFPTWTEVIAVILALGWTPPPITEEYEDPDAPFPPSPNRRLGNQNASRNKQR